MIPVYRTQEFIKSEKKLIRSQSLRLGFTILVAWGPPAIMAMLRGESQASPGKQHSESVSNYQDNQ